MLESDNGVLPLKGFGFTGTAKARAVVADIAELLTAIGASRVSDRFDGADVQASIRAAGIPGVSPEVDMTKYFLVHHTAADTIEHISADDLGRLVAAVASMAYVVADMPQTLDRVQP
jgi:hypothetical protein